MTRYKKQRHRHFTEFRDKDYRIARSMKEAYGFEPVLYVEPSAKVGKFEVVIASVLVVLAYAIVLALQF